MKHCLLWLWALLLPILLLAQGNCIVNRYGNAPYFQLNEVVLEHDIPYGTAPSYNHQIEQMKLDIAYPDFAIDSLSQRPLVVVIHGGGYYAGDKTDFDSLCINMAQRGYVAASINYRLGWNYGTGTAPEIGCNGSVTELHNAMYRAIQDARAALRYLVVNASIYGIDTANIFVVGQSAGGITALGAAFATQVQLDSLLPHVTDTLGGLDTVDNALRTNYTLKGVASMWGGLLDTNMLTAQHMPVLMFQGTGDTIVPYQSGPVFNCTSPAHYPTLYGSSSIVRRLQNLGICYELDSVPGAGHGVYPLEYRVQHIACFFRGIMCHACTPVEQYNIPAACVTTNGIAPTLEKAMQLYPNPTNGQFIIQTSGVAHCQLKLLNMLGQTILQQSLGDETTIDVSYLPQGIYLARIIHLGESLVVKLVLR